MNVSREKYRHIPSLGNCLTYFDDRKSTKYRVSCKPYPVRCYITRLRPSSRDMDCLFIEKLLDVDVRANLQTKPCQKAKSGT